MTVDYIRYDILTQDAMRSVVRTVLTDAASKGLPGEHHFFLSFDTRAEGVVLSPRLKAQYPKEMTIVLQHQFWDLTVANDRFEVGLSFSGIPERLGRPFRGNRRLGRAMGAVRAAVRGGGGGGRGGGGTRRRGLDRCRPPAGAPRPAAGADRAIADGGEPRSCRQAGRDAGREA